MGSVTYRKVGSRWHIRFREQGDEKVKTYDGSLPEYAIKRKSQWFKDEWERGYFHPFQEREQETRLTSAIERYCASKRRRGDWNKKTARISRERLEQSADFVGPDRMLSELRSDDFQQWIDTLTGSPYTKKSYRSTLNTFLKWCHEHKYTSRLLFVNLPENDRQQIRSVSSSEYVTAEQLRNLTEYELNQNSRQQSSPISDPSAHRSETTDLWWLMFWQLLTVDEALSIRPGDITNRSSSVRLPFGGEEKTEVPLVPPARKIIQHYRSQAVASDHPLFSTGDPDQIKSSYKKAMKGCFSGRKANLQQLRRGGIIHYLKLGKPLQYVSRLARHSSMEKTLRRYKSYIPELTDRAFEDIDSYGIDHTKLY